MAKRRNRFMQDAEDILDNPGEVLTTVPMLAEEKKEEEKDQVPVSVEEKKEAKEQAQTLAEEKKEKNESPINEILLDLVPNTKPKQETYGFYLDSDVHEEIVKLAKQSKTNKSRYLNALLRRILFNE